MDTNQDGGMPSGELGGIPDADMGEVSEPNILADGTSNRAIVHIEPMSLEDAANFPHIKKLASKVQQILALTAFGFSASTIARAWGVRPSAIRHMMATYDPDRKFQLSKQAKRAFLTKMLESRAAEALAYITPEKLEKANALALATIAEKMLKTIQTMEPKEGTRIMVGSVSDILNRLKAPIELERNDDGIYTDGLDKDDGAGEEQELPTVHDGGDV